jgi:hypothetical protein
MTDNPRHEIWPDLPYAAWKDTCATPQLWTQVAGKIRLAFTPWLNHSWHVTLYVTTRGLATSPIPYTDGRSFDIAFDLIDHVLDITVSDGGRKRLALEPQSVAQFYAAVTAALSELGIAARIHELPCEIPGGVPFGEDRIHRAYDAEYATRFWHALVQVDGVFKKFRTGFIGKCSPCHLFWGSFDLAVTRFSGRPGPVRAGGAPGVSEHVMQEAYSHEVSSAGFWPGGSGIDHASFYSYAYPEPAEFRHAAIRPEAAAYHQALGQFLLPYDAVRTAADPEATLMAFLQSTYAAAADTGRWDRAALEGPIGVPCVPRPLA